MKLDPRTFRIQYSLHAWTGVLVGLALFVMSYCGIFALFHEELHVWEDPAFSAEHAATPAQEPLSLDRLLAQVEAKVNVPHGEYLGFSLHEGMRQVPVWLSRDESGEEREFVLDARTGEIRPQHSRLAEELYQLHFFYQVPFGMQISGLIAVALFVTLLSGVLTHLKDLVRKWWVFRPEKRLRNAATDGHVALGILTLPFTIVMAWSGALLCLLTVLSGGLAFSVFGGDTTKLASIRHEEAMFRLPTHKATEPRLSLDELARRAARAVPEGDGKPFWFSLNVFGDAQEFAVAYFPREGLNIGRHAYLESSTGKVLKTTTQPVAGIPFERTMTDLHYGNYGGLLIKALYTLLALGLCAIALTGNLMWLERRDPLRLHLGNRILERLMAGTAPGLVMASGVYMLANRLLPASSPTRASSEFTLFLVSWAVATVLTFVPRWSPRFSASLWFALSAFAFLGVLGFDAMHSFEKWRHITEEGPASELVIALLALFLGTASAVTAKVLARGLPAKQPQRAPKAARLSVPPAIEGPTT